MVSLCGPWVHRPRFIIQIVNADGGVTLVLFFMLSAGTSSVIVLVFNGSIDQVMFLVSV